MKKFALALVVLLAGLQNLAFAADVKETVLGPMVAVSKQITLDFFQCKAAFVEELKGVSYTCQINIVNRELDQFVSGPSDHYNSDDCNVFLSTNSNGYKISLMGSLTSSDENFTQDQAVGCLANAFEKNGWTNKPLNSVYYRVQH